MNEYVEHQVKSKVEKFFRGFFKVLFMIIAAILFLLLFGYGFMLLWNWLMPDVFGLPFLTYWKAVGILVMAKLLFGHFDGKNHKKNPKKMREHFGGPRNKSSKCDFTKWEYYDEFWKEEGKNAFEGYIERKQDEKQ